MTKLNIAHITFDMAIAGTEQVIKQLVENLDSTRFNCSIFCIDGKIGDLGTALNEANYNVISSSKSRGSGLDFDLIQELRDFIRRENIQILHCHQYTPYIYGLFASINLKGTSVIFTEHGRFYPDSYKWKRLCLNPILSLFTHSITAISKATAEALIKYENFPRKKIKVIYNGRKVDDTALSAPSNIRKELQIADDAMVFGTVSRLDPIKNQEMMIEAFTRANKEHPNSYLIMVGDGPSADTLKALTEKLNMTDKITFTGFRMNTYDYFKAVDIFLLSSLSEGTSMTLLESMAFSKTSIVTDVGGNPEIVSDNETGLVTPSEDTQAFANAMIELMASPEKTSSLGQAANNRYREQFSEQHMIEQFESLYSSVSY